MSSIKDAVKEAMTAKGWSQTRLATESGVPQSRLSQWLAGIRDMTGANIEKVLKALGLTIN